MVTLTALKHHFELATIAPPQRAGRHHRVRELVPHGPHPAVLDLLLDLGLAPPPHDQQLRQLPRLLRRRHQVNKSSGTTGKPT